MANPVTVTIADKLVTTDTSASSLVVGGASPTATTGTGGINAGPIVGTTVNGSTSVSDSGGTLAAVRAGGIGIASQAALDIVIASSSTQLSRVATGSALQVLRKNAANTGYEFAAAPMSLLGSVVNGSDTTASATNVYTLAISGLTAADLLRVVVTMTTVGGTTTTQPVLYNATDSVVMATGPSNITTGTFHLWDAAASCVPNTTVSVQTQMLTSGGATPASASASSTFTNWTGSWTLALRTGAGGTDGTFRFAVRVYRIAGQ